MNNTIICYEYQKLLIGERGFTQRHWQAFAQLNSEHGNKYFNLLHNGLQFKEYVGIVQVAGLSVEIHPKIDQNNGKGNWKQVLLSMLKSAGKLSPETLGKAQVNKQQLNLLEVYFELFLKEVQLLVRKGFIKKYRKQTKNVTALKGKLEFAGQLRKNLVHKERFYTTHQVYDTDHLIHQVLFVALDIVAKMNSNHFIKSLATQALFCFPETRCISVNEATFQKINLNRKSKDYSYALELARLIILNYSPSISSGKAQMLSLLFDMNVLWENYVAKQLQKHLYQSNAAWEVSTQESKRFIGRHSLRPDIVLRHKISHETIVIDTKWKLADKYISVQDLRQVYTYAHYWNAAKVMLLYPGAPQQSSFRTYLNEFDTPKYQCKIGMVSVLDKDHNLSECIGADIMGLLEV